VGLSLAFAALLAALKAHPKTHNLYSLLLVLVSTLTAWAIYCFAPDAELYITGDVKFKVFHADISHLSVPGEAGQVAAFMGYAFLTAMIGFMESIAAANMQALSKDTKVLPNQELLAVGAANVVGSLFFCFPTMGSVGATSMLDAFGGRSGLANALSAATVGLFSLWLRGLVRSFGLSGPLLGLCPSRASPRLPPDLPPGLGGSPASNNPNNPRIRCITCPSALWGSSWSRPCWGSSTRAKSSRCSRRTAATFGW